MTKEISRKAYVEEAPPILAEITDIVIHGAAERQAIMKILHDTARSLKRAVKRAEALPAEYERVEIAETWGPTIEFSGRLLSETEFESRGDVPNRMRLELWETLAGAWIAATFALPEHGREIISATVIPAGEDEQARRFAAMEQWQWHERARSMVRKLDWTLRQDVE